MHLMPPTSSCTKCTLAGSAADTWFQSCNYCACLQYTNACMWCLKNPTAAAVACLYVQCAQAKFACVSRALVGLRRLDIHNTSISGALGWLDC